ncbi:MAG TPA: phosphoserine transaminase [Alphaproteobacteria bacterium]|nr:phosphoserine transaminase [Alphaproteobacteria bacterium]
MQKPDLKPARPFFSSGPCAKRPGWTLEALESSLTGRSHRAGPLKSQLEAVIEKHRALLGIPADYRIGIVPASDTGAVEMALWNLIGPRGVDALAWEAFGSDWVKDLKEHLKPADLRVFKAEYGQIPDLSKVDTDRDVVFVWNGTTSGARVPDGAAWIKPDRAGLTICDATSAVFAYDLPWERLDVVTWSWQKVLGGEGAHGMLVLSPRAVERILSHTPAWPMPKIFRLKEGGKFQEGIFKGETINTPSMIAVADCLDALAWVERIGGLKETVRRSRENLGVLEAWIKSSPWAAFLVDDPGTRSCTSVCLKIVDPWFAALPEEAREPFIKDMAKRLDREAAAFDVAGYRAAPPGLRVWCGATVEASDIAALTPWLDWAYESAKAESGKKAA